MQIGIGSGQVTEAGELHKIPWIILNTRRRRGLKVGPHLLARESI